MFQTRAIDRVCEMTPERFSQLYLQELGRPVILTDATQDWAALSQWSFQTFQKRYGADLVLPGIDRGLRFAKATTLEKFISYLNCPQEELAGQWVYASNGKLVKQNIPVFQPCDRFYLLNWYGFHRHPELFKEIRPYGFISDWVSKMPKFLVSTLEKIHEVDYWSILLGPENTVTRLHQDFASTHGSLTQIVGRKKVILFSPKYSAAIEYGSINPEAPQTKAGNELSKVEAYECVLEPGEMLFWPANWWHYVRSLDASISVSHNFFNRHNAKAHLSNIAKDLPYYLKGLWSPRSAGLSPYHPTPKI